MIDKARALVEHIVGPLLALGVFYYAMENICLALGQHDIGKILWFTVIGVSGQSLGVYIVFLLIRTRGSTPHTTFSILALMFLTGVCGIYLVVLGVPEYITFYSFTETVGLVGIFLCATVNLIPPLYIYLLH